jgi:large subunit ribosomal protein L4
MAEQSVEFPAELFDVPANIPLIHQVVTAQLAAARQGTHKTKNRGEVSGSGVKPFKQKGTGRSRQGSIRAPEHRGGGTVHGPQPRDYSQRTPKKMIAAALLGALSDRARAGRIHVVDALVTGDAPSTKQAAEALAGFANGKRQLVVVERADELAIKSVRNLKHVDLLAVDQLNTYDVLLSDDIVFTRAAYDTFVASRATNQADTAVDSRASVDTSASATAEPAADSTTEEESA